MTTLISNELESKVLAKASVSTLKLSLHIKFDGSEKTIPLATGKCTVGSSSRCQVQLPCPEVRPLHCLIVQEGDATTITRWAPGALLNGREFSTSEFILGDCLQIGDAEVTLVAQDQAASEKYLPAQPEVREETTAPPSFSNPPEKLAEETSRRSTLAVSSLESDRLVRQLWSANYNARQRCRNLVRSLRDVRIEAGDFDQQIEILQGQLRKAFDERGEISSELDHLRTESMRREEQVAEEMDRLISELNSAYEGSNDTASVQQLEQELKEALDQGESRIGQLQSELQRVQTTTESAQAQAAEQADLANRLRLEIEVLQSERGKFHETIAEFQRNQAKGEAADAARDGRIGELLRELEQVHCEILSAEERNAEQTKEFQELQSALQQAEQERQALSDSKSRFQESQGESEASLLERDQRIEQLEGELEAARLAVDESIQSNEEQSTHSKELREEVERLQAMREQLANKGEENLQRVVELEKLLSERDEHLSSFQGVLDKAQSARILAEEHEAAQEARGKLLETELDQLRKEREQIADSSSEMQHRIGELALWLGERDDQIGHLQHELAQAQAATASAEECGTEQTARFEELQAELAKAQEEREGLLAAHAEHQQQEQQWRQSLDERDREEQAFRTEQRTIAELLQQELNELQQQRDQLLAAQSEHVEHQQQWEQSLAERDLRIEEIQAEYQQVCESLQSFQKDAFDQIDTCQRLEKELEEACRQRDEIDGQHPEYESQIRDLHETLQYRDRQLVELSEELASLGQRRSEAQSELEQHRAVTEQLETDLQKVRDELQHSVDQTQQLQEKCIAAESKLALLEAELESKDAHLVESSLADSDLQQERDKLAETLETARGELESLREQVLAANRDAKAAVELAKASEEEKTDLASTREERSELVERLSADLEGARQELADERAQSQQVEQLYQQSQQDLDEAKSCLLAAEESLTERATTPAANEWQEPIADSEIPVAEETPDEEPVVSEEDANAAVARLQELSVWVDQANPSADAEEEVAEEEVEKEEFTPPSFIEQYGGEFTEDEPTSQPPLAENQPTAIVSPEPTADRLDDESEDAALEAYMQSMMERVRGGSGGEEVSASLPAEDLANKDPVAAVDAAVARVASESNVDFETEAPLNLESLRNSSQKPALPTDMVALRELANSSARTAIASHHKRQYAETALSKLLICVIATGLAAYVLLTTDDYLSLSALGGWIAGAVALVWGSRVVGVLLEAILQGSQSGGPPAEIPVEDEQLPIGG